MNHPNDAVRLTDIHHFDLPFAGKATCLICNEIFLAGRNSAGGVEAARETFQHFVREHPDRLADLLEQVSRELNS